MTIQQKNEIFSLALLMFTNKKIIYVNILEDTLVEFTTIDNELGEIIESPEGVMQVWIEDILVYQIEHSIYEILLHQDDENLIELYGYITELDKTFLQDRSIIFLETVKTAVENLLISGSVPIVGQVQIGNTEFIYKNGKKIVVDLN